MPGSYRLDYLLVIISTPFERNDTLYYKIGLVDTIGQSIEYKLEVIYSCIRNGQFAAR
jgi:hypothetical protein